jgi:hypothetical protein
MDDTCFQKMKGRREEYLASCPMKAQAHLAHVENAQQAETSLNILDELSTYAGISCYVIKHCK